MRIFYDEIRIIQSEKCLIDTEFLKIKKCLLTIKMTDFILEQILLIKMMTKKIKCNIQETEKLYFYLILR